MQSSKNETARRHVIDDESNPLVSVIIPAYNHEKFIEEAVRSVWEQTYPNIELIVIDDGSSDGTAHVIERLKDSSPIPMRYLTKENEGICRTLNMGIALADGSWIAILASDDKYSPEFVRRNMEVAAGLGFQKVVLHCDAYIMNTGSVVTGRISEISIKPPAAGDAFLDIANGRCRIVSSTVVLPKSLMQDIGGYDENLKAEDFDMHLRVACYSEYYYLNEPLFYARYSPDSLGRSPWV
ncbi:MAG: glycosyltransferase, partial [Gammaproteobacteria bacterium]|nr:glycosyltransferase [Gammaproteobacteria bacterium]